MTKFNRTLLASVHREDGTTIIPLSQRLFAIIDTADFDLVKDHNWHAHRKVNGVYAETHIRDSTGKRNKVGMHRLLMGTGDLLIDHVDNDGLNNRRSNLRFCTYVQNGRNHKGHNNRKSGITTRGVYWHKRHKKWYAMIKYDGKNRHLGMFDTQDEAVEVRRKAELAVDPEFFKAQ